MKPSLALVLAALVSLAGGTLASAQCTFSLSASNQSFTALGGPGSFTVNTSNDCDWTAVSSVVWITFPGDASGVGTGTVNYTVDQNFSTTNRSGTLIVADRTNTVNQARSQAVICPVRLTGILTYSAEDNALVRVRIGKRDLVEDTENRLALALDPDAHTLRLIEIDEENDELNELAVSERCVFLPGNQFAGDLIFEALPVFNETANVDFIGDGSLQVRATFVTDTNGLPSRVTGKLIGVLNDPVNGNGDGPSAIFKGVLTPAGKSFTP